MIAIEAKIPLKAGGKEYKDLMTECLSNFDEGFAKKLEKCVKENEGNKGWWPDDSFRRHLCRRYGLKHGSKKSKTYFSKKDLLVQLIPGLQMTYVFRRIFGVEPGVGNILNIDESMQYLYNPDLKTWG